VCSDVVVIIGKPFKFHTYIHLQNTCIIFIIIIIIIVIIIIIIITIVILNSSLCQV